MNLSRTWKTSFTALAFLGMAVGVACQRHIAVPTQAPFVNTPTWTFTTGPSATDTFTTTATDTITNTPTNTSAFTATDTPTFTPTLTPTSTFTDTPTDTVCTSGGNTCTFTWTPTSTDTATDTATSTPTDTPTNTDTPTATGTPTDTYTVTATSTATGTPTMTYTSTPTSTPSNTYTNTATKTPTNTPTPTCNVYTLAGNGSWGTTDGIGTAASFHNPSGLCVDSSGNIFIADANNHRIRKISSPCAVINGNVSTPAGSTAGYTDATGAAAQFYLPTGVAADASGNVYVADLFNNLIRKITSANVVTTLAGNTVGVPTTNSGSADGTGTSASFYGPSGVCVNAAGTTLYVADTNNNMIRAISLPGGVVTTLAGQVTGGFLDATGTAAKFTNPVDLAVNAAGTTVYVADTGNNRIRYIEVATGVVGTLAGTGAANYVDGIGTIAKFNSPRGIDVDTTTGNIFVADYSNNRIRQITPAGVVTTKAGSGAPGILDGTGSTAQFNSPFGLAVNSSCSPPVIYVSQITGVIIRAIQ